MSGSTLEERIDDLERALKYCRELCNDNEVMIGELLHEKKQLNYRVSELEEAVEEMRER